MSAGSNSSLSVEPQTMSQTPKQAEEAKRYTLQEAMTICNKNAISVLGQTMEDAKKMIQEIESKTNMKENLTAYLVLAGRILSPLFCNLSDFYSNNGTYPIYHEMMTYLLNIPPDMVAFVASNLYKTAEIERQKSKDLRNDDDALSVSQSSNKHDTSNETQHDSYQYGVDEESFSRVSEASTTTQNQKKTYAEVLKND